jgi:hypothetical protein
MATPAWDNLDDFLDPADFGVIATVSLGSGQSRPVSGIYDGPYEDAQLADTHQDTTKPRFRAKASDLVGVKRGDGIMIPGEGAFGILTGPQPIGDGMAFLELAAE